MIASTVQTVIWDFDGTVARRQGKWSGALADNANRLTAGKRTDAETIRRNLGRGFPWHFPDRPHTHIRDAQTWWDALNDYFTDVYVRSGYTPSEARRLAENVRYEYPKKSRWELYDDVLPALKTQAAAGRINVLLTNHVPELPAILDALDLGERFARVFNSAETGYEKPNPEAFRPILDRWGPADRLWMVGDSPKADRDGARAVGIGCYLVDRRNNAGGLGGLTGPV